MGWKCWNRKKKEAERKIKINDEVFNAQFKYSNNYIKTSKYNVFTFLPINLWEQFQRVANLYFLFLMILQLVPEISSLNPYTTLVPLVSVLSISAIKDCYDDIQRHKSDNQVNHRVTKVIRNDELIELVWQKVVVGDIIKIKSEEFIAADLLILSTSEPSGLCYVETAELDGETNLKSKQCLASTAELEDDIGAFGEVYGELDCEAPNNNLSRFQGTLTLDNKKYTVNNDNLLLRGCLLRNTKWCFALVVFAGADTKLMKNSGLAMFKRTHVDKYLNRIILMIVLCLFIICVICAVCSGIWENSYGYYFEVFNPWESDIPKNPTSGAAVIGTLVFFSYIILLNTVVPISLYVSVEMVRLFQSFFINWDEKMMYMGTAARARTTTLNEELGQVQYIFSDKTGTLTQNIMAFNRCSINGVSYGDDDMEIQGKTTDYEAAKKKFTTNFNFYDPKLYKVLGRKDLHACDFFTLLALCHTVMADVKDDELVYMAQSPDEEALVMAARIFGFVFESRTIKTITIKVDDELQVYDLLSILDFNNVRKRMSVIVRDCHGDITLYCKGADTLVYERLSPNQAYIKRKTSEHMEMYASEGLRTLCLAKKNLDTDYFEDWSARYEEASTSNENRDERIDLLFEEIESNMTLLGATAIEDKLQEGVPDTIYNLALAGIKIWVLTGDKQETAINVAYSCQLFTDDFEDPLVVDGEDYDSVCEQLTDFLNVIGDGDSSQENVTSNNNKLTYGLVVNGHSLVFALEDDMEQLLLAVASRCKAVVFCRVTPLQKANVVDLVKRYKKVVTLSIGDGANDVSMIKTAHIGIGISGQEGLQAVMSSDFSIAQFRFLQRLLLVHGRLSYYRMCKFLRYFFYKNFAYTFCELWYAFFVGFSAQTIFGGFFVMCFNMVYTSMPVMSVGVFDQDVSDATSLKYPKLYTPGPRNEWFGKKQFLLAGTHGLLTSLGLFFLVYGHYHSNIREDGKSVSDFYSFGFVLSTILVIVVSVQISLETQYWTMFTQISIFGSIISVFLFNFAYNSIFHGSYYNTLTVSIEVPAYSFIIILAIVLSLIPGVVYKFYYADVHPTLIDKAKYKQRLESKLSKLIPKTKPSDAPRSTRRHRGSVRSGYAFSHQEGFAKLITGGKLISTKNMK